MSVNNLEENLFITSWLRQNDPMHRKWHTSGRDQGNNAWKWEGDKTDFTMINELWLPTDIKSPEYWKVSTYRHAAYKLVIIKNEFNYV